MVDFGLVGVYCENMNEREPRFNMSADSGGGSGGSGEGEEKKAPDREEVAVEMPEEIRLSPEVIEKIMEKVEDIDKEGVAYSVVNSDFRDTDKLFQGDEGLESVLATGLLPIGKDNHLHFNIVGRMREYEKKKVKPGSTEISSSYFSKKLGAVIVLFRLDELVEIVPTNDETRRVPEKCFRANDFDGLREFFSEMRSDQLKNFRDAKLDDLEVLEAMRDYGIYPPFRSITEYGFISDARVSPENFMGIVLNIYQDEVESKAKEVSMRMNNVFKTTNSLERLLPVYDVSGSLWWPRQMSYEEVKLFVKQRDDKSSEREL